VHDRVDLDRMAIPASDPSMHALHDLSSHSR
jgi:hypothetical protein